MLVNTAMNSSRANMYAIYKFNTWNKAGMYFLILGEIHAAYGTDLVLLQFHMGPEGEGGCKKVFPLLMRRLNRRLAMEQAEITNESLSVDYVIEMLVLLWGHARDMARARVQGYPFTGLAARLPRYAETVREVVSRKSSEPWFLDRLRGRGLTVV